MTLTIIILKMPFSILTISIIALSKMTLSSLIFCFIMALSMMKLGKMTFSVVAHSNMVLIAYIKALKTLAHGSQL
jgi:hypothetical protein